MTIKRTFEQKPTGSENKAKNKKWQRRDLNPRPKAYELAGRKATSYCS